MDRITAADTLTVAPILFILAAISPMLVPGSKVKINLSAWAVVVANAWLAALGGLFPSQGAASVYLLANAILLTPVIALNLREGVWANLPGWHKLASCLLPVGGVVGYYMGGVASTWISCLISALLTIQLVESSWKRLSKESILTWILFLTSDGMATLFGWAGAGPALRVLMLIWVMQCVLVILVETRNRAYQGGSKTNEGSRKKGQPQTKRSFPVSGDVLGSIGLASGRAPGTTV